MHRAIVRATRIGMISAQFRSPAQAGVQIDERRTGSRPSPGSSYLRRGLLLPTLLIAACTAQVDETTLLRPVASGTVSAEAIAKAAPAYTLSHHAVTAPDGVRLHAVHLRQPGARATILYFGGNGYTIGRFGAWTASVFQPLGVDLVIADHRGYGQSSGTPKISDMEGDSAAMFDFVTALPDRAPGPIVLHGHSLGSFIAGHLAATRATGGVVPEGSVTTAEEWVDVGTPGIAKPFVKVRIAEGLEGRGNLANMARIEEPLLLLVGEKDGTTPPRLSKGLYEASPLPPGRKTLLIVKGARHDNALTKAEAVAAYRRFLDSVAGR